ncbi:hypothetical protein MUP77_13190 [Candidatus Bathyarchaeota archaeon]|nr:hypothetical protein [Candidatus Bathyarchaeota archaeon]
MKLQFKPIYVFTLVLALLYSSLAAWIVIKSSPVQAGFQFLDVTVSPSGPVVLVK